MHPIFDDFYRIGIIPVLEIDSADRAVPLAESLQAGDLPIAEVALGAETALGPIESIARSVSGVIVGAGV